MQPHSGSQANMAVYFSVLKPGDAILGMDLAHGGHLTHGSRVSFSGILYRSYFYGVDRTSERIDYDAVRKAAEECRPRMIVVGASAYSRVFDFPKFQEIAKSVGAYLMVDVAHIAGLIVTGLHPNPVPYADFVTTTTHKTLRGPRGGMVMCKAEYAKALDVTGKGITGKEAEAALDEAGITVNKNAIPYDQKPPAIASGIRLGTPIVSTRGMGEEEMGQIADAIEKVLSHPGDSGVRKLVRSRVRVLCGKFPIFHEYR